NTYRCVHVSGRSRNHLKACRSATEISLRVTHPIQARVRGLDPVWQPARHKKGICMSPIEDIDHRKLHFDEDNPRLPESLRGAAPNEFAKYYYENAVVSDLVQSMAESGFFPHEPMIVTPKGRNQFTVVEGNRRLTALCIIHGRPEADELPAPEPPVESE